MPDTYALMPIKVAEPACVCVTEEVCSELLPYNRERGLHYVLSIELCCSDDVALLGRLHD